MGSIAVVVGVIWNDVLCVHFVDEMSPVAKDGSGSCIITRPRRHISVGNWKVVMHNFCECVIRKGFCKMECKNTDRGLVNIRSFDVVAGLPSFI